MVRVPSSLLSTITSRLAVLVAFPVLGMVVLGAVVAVGQWQDRSAAQQLRRDAHIVQLLASLAVNLDAEADGIAAIQQAEALGFDLDQVLGADLSLEDTSGLSELFEQLAAQDPAWLADADATASVLEDWNNFRTYRSQPGSAPTASSGISGAGWRPTSTVHCRPRRRSSTSVSGGSIPTPTSSPTPAPSSPDGICSAPPRPNVRLWPPTCSPWGRTAPTRSATGTCWRPMPSTGGAWPRSRRYCRRTTARLSTR